MRKRLGRLGVFVLVVLVVLLGVFAIFRFILLLSFANPAIEIRRTRAAALLVKQSGITMIALAVYGAIPTGELATRRVVTAKEDFALARLLLD